MITESTLVRLYCRGDPISHAIERVRAERWIDEYVEGGHARDTFSLLLVPQCRVCGVPAATRPPGPHRRCARHAASNPCAIEGCKRSRAAPESGRLADDSWMCSEHWRRFVPPRSLRRRAYHAFWRKAKRHGWTPELIEQFNRFWDTLVSAARAKSVGGTINVIEINRLFGWEG